MTATGLLECYWAGLPYFRISLLGDLFYASLLFGAAEIVNHFISNQSNGDLRTG